MPKLRRDYFSVSSLKLYCKCPNCYRLKYVMKVKQLGTKEVMHFGKAVHAGIAAYYLKQDKRAALFTALKEGFDDVRNKHGVLPSFDSMKEEGYTLLGEYPNQCYHFGNVRDVEFTHIFTIKHPITQEELELPIKVIIDLTTDLGIVDHKIKASAFRPADIAFDIQRTGYWFAYEDLYSHEPQFFAYNQILRRKGLPKFVEPLKFKITLEDKIQFFDFCKAILGRIHSGEFPRNPTLRANEHEYPNICV